MTDSQDFAARLADRVQHGVMSFPLTAFTEAGEVDLEGFRAHVASRIEAGAAAVFPCCGTGEFFSLSEPEYAALVQVAVEEAAGRLPVIAGLGYGWAQAVRFAAIAERGGADAGLLLPHYLVGAPQAGLVRHVREVAERSSLPLIVYQRDQVKYTVESFAALAEVPTVVGLKDGHGDLDQLQRLRLLAPDDFLFLNGTPTAEMQARAYRAIGIEGYSSAVHAFAPEISGAFFRALRDNEDELVDRLLRHFYLPLVELRDRRPGYAVSLVKAAARLRGQRVGPVRAPLTDPSEEETRTLARILTAGLGVVA